MTTSAEIKAEAMAWLRYGKRMTAVCTEVRHGYYVMDVLGCNAQASIEVEVKTSKADFKKDFDNKAPKFFMYESADSTQHTAKVPNQIYYAVPENLKEYGLALLEERFPKAGLVVYRPELELLAGKNLELVRSARKLHGKAPARVFLHDVFLRTSSELCGARLALVDLRKKLDKTLNGYNDLVVNVAAAHAGVLDMENPEQDLEQRASEYHHAMEPNVQWHELSVERQEYWRAGTRRLLDSRNDVPEHWHKALS